MSLVSSIWPRILGKFPTRRLIGLWPIDPFITGVTYEAGMGAVSRDISPARSSYSAQWDSGHTRGP